MKTRRRILGVVFAAAVSFVSIPQASFAACTAGTVDAAFGADGTNGYVQSGPLSLFGVTGAIEGVIVSSADNGIVANTLVGSDSTGTAILGTAKFRHGGVLDTTFGGFGLSSPGGFVPGASGTTSTLTQDSSGNVIVARADGAGVTVTRFTPTGNLDTGFGTSGSTSVALPNLLALIIGASTAADGSIFVAASAPNPPAPNLMQPVVLKFTSAGVLDPSFGSGGVAFFYPSALVDPATWGRATEVRVLPSGQILVAGRFQIAAGHREFFAARLLASGSLDASFGTGGVTLVDFGPVVAQGRKITVQDDGKVVIAGTLFDNANNSFISLARLLANGAIDATFGTGGKVSVTTGFGAAGFDVSIQNNGKILVGGAVSNDVAQTTSTALAARFTTAGALDPAFGTGGYALVFPPGMAQSSAAEVIYLSGGKILLRVGASTSSGLNTDFLVRLDSGSGAGCH
jgi:uncharacterized delta-60 repeat protein